ncbi:unnamed protein product [Clonostachys solani]|uniref:Uncharacterized protein n=1 Tax=Clonostachys solani TaxID=160281 RepID=A0A9N9W488_9HYPO|nr:unnamed protein product [Clonostachys solani]
MAQRYFHGPLRPLARVEWLQEAARAEGGAAARSATVPNEMMPTRPKFSPLPVAERIDEAIEAVVSEHETPLQQ